MTLSAVLRGRLASDVAWVTAGHAVGALAALVGLRALTDRLAPEVFGSIALLTGVGALLSATFCNPFLHVMAALYPAARAGGLVGALYRHVARSVARGSVLALAAVLISAAAIAVGEHAWRALVSGGLVAALCAAELWRTFHVSFLTAARKQRTTALWMGIEQLLRPLFAVASISWLGPRADAVLLAYLLATLGPACVFVGVVSTRLEPGSGIPAGAGELGSRIRLLAMPLLPVALFGAVVAVGDRYAIGWMWGLAAAGQYAVLYGLVSRPFGLFGNILLTTIRPALMESVSEQDVERQHRLIAAWYWAIAAATAGALALTAGPALTGLAVGEQYRSGLHLIPWLVLGQALMLASHAANTVNLAGERSAAVTRSESAAALTFLLAGVPLIMVWGPRGAALATAFSFGVQFVAAKRSAPRPPAFLPASRVLS